MRHRTWPVPSSAQETTTMPLHPNIYLEVCHLINILDQFNHPLSAEIVDPDYKFILEAARFKSNGKNNYNPKEVPWRKTLSADP